MIEKNISSRIKHKHDIEANWAKALNFIPKAGEIIIYDADENNSTPRIKIGDGETTVNELPFITSGSSWDDIADKPFHENGIIKKEALPEGYPYREEKYVPIYEANNVEFQQSEQYVSYSVKSTFGAIEIGKLYTIIWDGVTYSDLIAFDDEGYPTIGASYRNTSADMPFCIYTSKSSGEISLEIDAYPKEDSNRFYSFSILTKGISPIVMSLEFLPEHKHSQNDLIDKPNWNNIENKPFETIGDIIFDGIALKDAITGMDYIITIQNGNLVSSLKCSGIEIITMPNKTEYMVGESFDFTGVTAIAHYPDGNTKDITNELYTTDKIIEDTTFIKINYTESGVTYTTNINITVKPFDAASVLIDFDYTDNKDGTYTITGWKQTLNGEPSTEMIIPDYSVIII